MSRLAGRWVIAPVVIATTILVIGTAPLRLVDIEIVQGKLVPEGALVEVVGLTYGNAREPLCTGALVGSRVVLTAAHCICEVRPTHVFVGRDPALGLAGRAEYYPVAAVRSAGPCDGDLRGRDFALLKLDRPVPRARPFAFAADSLVDLARSGRIVGYGATDLDATQVDHRKREARVPIVSANCSQVEQAEVGCIADAELVAGKRQFPDTCKGDSGGPLLLSAGGDAGASLPEARFIAGITSRPTADSTRACGEGGIYSRMNQRARSWIAQARAGMGA